jgi:hypothetical protein
MDLSLQFQSSSICFSFQIGIKNLVRRPCEAMRGYGPAMPATRGRKAVTAIQTPEQRAQMVAVQMRQSALRVLCENLQTLLRQSPSAAPSEEMIEGLLTHLRQSPFALLSGKTLGSILARLEQTSFAAPSEKMMSALLASMEAELGLGLNPKATQDIIWGALEGLCPHLPPPLPIRRCASI